MDDTAGTLPESGGEPIYRLERAIAEGVRGMPGVCTARRGLLQRLGFGAYPRVRIRRGVRGGMIVQVRVVAEMGASARVRGAAVQALVHDILNHHPQHAAQRIDVTIAGLAPAVSGAEPG